MNLDNEIKKKIEDFLKSPERIYKASLSLKDSNTRMFFNYAIKLFNDNKKNDAILDLFYLQNSSEEFRRLL